MRFWKRPTEAKRSPDKNPISWTSTFLFAISSAQLKIAGATGLFGSLM
jgi:hypothetical protein